jgi:autotransporter-associated beta strand protein
MPIFGCTTCFSCPRVVHHSRCLFSRLPRAALLGLILPVFAVQAHSAQAIDWDTVPIIQHSDYQSITESPVGSGNWRGDFAGPLPFRLVGVVLNDSGDWLDATAHYTDAYAPWYLGGQSEIFVQAVNLDGTQWDPDPNSPFSDFGGTACWMGQNYGNLPWIKDPQGSYSDEAWYNELNRLQLWHPDTSGLPAPVSQPIRRGDLVEIRTSVGGLYYSGKMNVNEQHSNDPSQDFEVVVLQRNYGVPAPAELALSNLKNPDNSFIFDPAAPRDSGAEHLQMTMVKLNGVRLKNPLLWGPNMDLQLVDDTGRDFDVHLGLDPGFCTYTPPTGTYDVTGVIDQESANGRDGYRLLALEAASFSAVSTLPVPVWSSGGGSDARWSVAANWSVAQPIDGRELHFDGNANAAPVNDFPNNTLFAGIVFNPGAAAFTLFGNAARLGRVANFSTAIQTIDLSINTDDADCVFLAEPGNILVAQPILGVYGLRKFGSAALTLSAPNAYSGLTDIQSGVLKLADGGTIDSSAGIQISPGAALEIEGGNHHLAPIFGNGEILISDSAQVVVDSVAGNALTIEAGSALNIAPLTAGQLINAQPVPEPGTTLLLKSGVSLLGAYRVARKTHSRRKSRA